MKKYSIEQKHEIVAEYKKYHSPKDIQIKYGIAKSTLYHWINTFDEKRESVSHTKKYSAWDIHLLERELRTLREENQIFRESGCSTKSPVKDKIAAIEKLKNKFSIYAICRTLNLSHGTYYHRNKYRPEKTTYQVQDEILTPLVKKYFYDSKERFGADKIKVMLDNQGIEASKKHILRIMREQNLVCKQKKLRGLWCPMNKYRKNKLKRHFTQEHPNQYWVSDITQVPLLKSNTPCYICTIIDLFSRKVIGASVSEIQNIELVKSAFAKAYADRNNPENLTLHSDQGCQYTSYVFRKYLRDLNVKQSYSFPGSPLDNAVAESFNSIMKREELSYNLYTSKAQVEQAVNEYIDFFNNYRPHRKLKNMTPARYEQIYYQEQAILEEERENLNTLKEIVNER